jgi:hypothetical protein
MMLPERELEDLRRQQGELEARPREAVRAEGEERSARDEQSQGTGVHSRSGRGRRRRRVFGIKKQMAMLFKTTLTV